MNIYFVGIGGVGIGPLAQICRDAGYTIAGSDVTASPFTINLSTNNSNIALNQDGSNIAKVHEQQKIDWLIFSSSIPQTHPEIQFALRAGIKISKRAELINHILRKEKLQMLAISGTHGKTTTTAMLVWLFKQFDKPISYSIGTDIGFGNAGAYQPGSNFFAYECDEYDRNMLEFKPFFSVITSVDYDHPDIYPTPTDYDNAFIDFAHQSQNLLMWQNDHDRLSMTHPQLTVVSKADQNIAKIKLPGIHNRQNSWQVAKLFEKLFPELDILDILAALSTFPGTSRRFEKLATNLYTDYAHHPTEIRATLQLAHELNNNIVVIYQPHQNIRQHKIINLYQDCFANAKHLYWLPTYLSREDKNQSTLTPNQLIGQLTNPQIAEPALLDHDLRNKIEYHRQQNDLVLLMCAGNADQWLRNQLAG